MNHSPLYRDFSLALSRKEVDPLVWCTDGKKDRTFGDLARAVNGWKAAFQKAKVKRVALYFTELFDSGAALLGAMAAGVVAVLPADTTEGTVRRLADGICEACAGEFSVHCPLPLITAEASDTPCRDTFNPEDCLVELFTSGSTGMPSRIVKRLRQLFVGVRNIDERLAQAGVTQDALIISTASQQHIYGLLYYLLWTIASVHKTWAHRAQTPEAVIELAGRYEKSAWISSPAHLSRLPDSEGWNLVRGHLQVITSSGGPLSEEALRKTIDLTGLSPVESLGSSESGGIAVRQRRFDKDGKITGVEWRPHSGVEWRSENGLLALRSAQLFSDGWEVTPDRIAPCPDGEHFIHLGRMDRIVKVEEKRVSLTHMEKVLEGTPYLKTAKVITLEDKRKTLAVAAIPSSAGFQLLKTQGKSALVAALKSVLTENFEAVCHPRRWRFVHELKETSMGKVSVPDLMTLFDAKTPQATLLERNDSEALFCLTVPAMSPYFEGHFPGFPILPGVTQLQWAALLGKDVFGIEGNFTELLNLKFVNPVLPGSSLLVRLKWEKTSGRLTTDWRGHAGEKYSSATFVFSPTGKEKTA